MAKPKGTMEEEAGLLDEMGHFVTRWVLQHQTACCVKARGLQMSPFAQRAESLTDKTPSGR